MAGGNIICGAVDTADKSGSALGGVLDQIESLSEWTHDPTLTALFARIRCTMTGDGDSEWSDYIEISSDHARLLQPLFHLAQQRLVEELGTSDPLIAMERDETVDGLDPVDAKWGAVVVGGSTA